MISLAAAFFHAACWFFSFTVVASADPPPRPPVLLFLRLKFGRAWARGACRCGTQVASGENVHTYAVPAQVRGISHAGNKRPTYGRPIAMPPAPPPHKLLVSGWNFVLQALQTYSVPLLYPQRVCLDAKPDPRAHRGSYSEPDPWAHRGRHPKPYDGADAGVQVKQTTSFCGGGK